ncbi:MAG TPA: hypothetical protein VGE51_06305 [Fontimonas sp.]
MAFSLSAARRTGAITFALLLSACAGTYDPNEPVAFYTDIAVPVDRAVPHLAEVVGQRITIRGVPSQNEGSCSGVQPLARKDWMLTGKEHCLWVNGRTEEVRLLDLRGSRSKDEVSVTGELVKTESGVFVLKVDRP